MKNRLIAIIIFSMLFLGGGHQTWAQETDQEERSEQSLLINKQFTNLNIREVVEELSRLTGKTITLGKNVSGRVSVTIRNLYWTKALRVIARKIDAFIVEHGPDWVEIIRPPLVTFSTDPQGTDIKAILDAIAVNYGFNLVMSDQVSGIVHLRLNRVPWRKAVEVAVKSAGNYAVVEEDYDILRVVPVADLATQLETRVFPLKYITAPSDVQARMTSSYADISQPTTLFTLQESLKKVITANIGFLDFDADNRAFIVKDTQPVLKEVESIIEMLDVPLQQVLVEVYVVSTNKADFIDFGIDWGAAGPVVTMTGGKMFHRLPFQIGRGGFEDRIGIPVGDQPTGDVILGGITGTEGSKFAIPNPTDFTNALTAPFTAGELDFTAVQAVLKFIETDTESKVVQSPKLMVIDNRRATIFSGDEIRYAQSQQVSAQDGSLNIVFNEASGSPVNVGFQMFITPHVIPGTNKIILDVIPQSDLLTGTTSPLSGFERFGTGSTAIDLPRVSSQTVVTQVMVESGRTVMIGGLVSYSDSKTDRKIPFLGDIPFLDFIFRNKSRTKTVNNLTIFIRPTIAMDDVASRQALYEDLKRREERALKDFQLRFKNSDSPLSQDK